MTPVEREDGEIFEVVVIRASNGRSISLVRVGLRVAPNRERGGYLRRAPRDVGDESLSPMDVRVMQLVADRKFERRSRRRSLSARTR